MNELVSASSKTFEEDEKRFAEYFAKASAVLAGVLVMLGVGLDQAFYPEMVREFFILRLLLSVALIAGAWIVVRKYGIQMMPYSTFIWVFFVQAMMCWMIYRTDGELSVYFVGLALAISALGLFLAVGTVESSVFMVFTLFMYSCACMFRENGVQDWARFLGHLLFLSFYSAVSLVGVALGVRWRRDSFLMKAELHRQATEIRDQSESMRRMQSDLVRSEKMAAIGTLASGILHEISNPLNYSSIAVVLAMKEGGASKTYSKRVDENLVDAKEGLDKMRGIVDDLKKFAYQPSGDLHSQSSRSFALVDSINAAKRLASYDIGHIRVKVDVPPDLEIEGDESAVTSVFINLFSNSAYAIRAAKRVDPLIEVSAFERSGRVAVTVKDNGAGIARHLLPKVMEPFFTTRESGAGLGLGLSLSQRTIERHDGVISVSSEEGQWTKFRFDLPLAIKAD